MRSTTCRWHIGPTTSAVSSSERLISPWYALASARAAASSVAIALDPSRRVLRSLLADSFNASVTCASDTRKMRFHGSKNFACFSPNVLVEMNTSF